MQYLHRYAIFENSVSFLETIVDTMSLCLNVIGQRFTDNILARWRDDHIAIMRRRNKT